jgi:hypothetical protein
MTCRLFESATSSYFTRSRHAVRRQESSWPLWIDSCPTARGRSCECRNGPTFKKKEGTCCFVFRCGAVVCVARDDGQCLNSTIPSSPSVVLLCCDRGCGIHWRYHGPNRPATTRSSVAKTWSGGRLLQNSWRLKIPEVMDSASGATYRTIFWTDQLVDQARHRRTRRIFDA